MNASVYGSVPTAMVAVLCVHMAIAAETGITKAIPTEEQAARILRTVFATDRPTSAIVFVSEGGNPSASRAKSLKIAQEFFRGVPVNSPAGEVARQRDIESNAERLFMIEAGGRLYVDRYRRTSEGSRNDFRVFEVGEAVDVAAPATQSLLHFVADGEQSSRSLDHRAKRIVLSNRKFADPAWITHGGHSPAVLGFFLRSSLAPVVGPAVATEEAPSPATISVFCAPRGAVPNWKWDVELQQQPDQTWALTFSQANLREPVLEATFADESFRTVQRLTIRNATTGASVYTREVTMTDENGRPVAFAVQEYKPDGSPMRLNRFKVEHWSTEPMRGDAEPLISEDLSSYKIEDTRR